MNEITILGSGCGPFAPALDSLSSESAVSGHYCLFSCNLKALSEKIDTDKMKKPAFLMVLTGTEDYVYLRFDGVYVVPIGCLKD